jgi:hypothetical protein
MPETVYRNRRAVQIENDSVRVTVLVEGGHIAEILHKPTGVNPLWTPPWPSIEPSTYNSETHPEYGADAESKLLAGIMGHNACVDLFGGPSPEEAAAGVTVHGEASVRPYDVQADGGVMRASVDLPSSELRFERTLRLDGPRVLIDETVENQGAWDRPIAWTQHVTLGPPFLERGLTRFEAGVRRSRTYESEFGDLFPTAKDFTWPNAPLRDGGVYDLRVFSDRPTSAGFTTHLVEGGTGWFLATSSQGVAFAYVWKCADFPWLGIWEENCSRQAPPWNGKTITRGMEFGASPVPEPRRQMIDRGSLFGVPAFKWLPAGRSLSASYYAIIAPAAELTVDKLTS